MSLAKIEIGSVCGSAILPRQTGLTQRLVALNQSVLVRQCHLVFASKHKISALIAVNSVSANAAVESVFALSAHNQVFSIVPVNGVLASASSQSVLAVGRTESEQVLFFIQ